ncbi:MAG: FMN-binding protein [Clostridiales bacterium]|nr:FMN-binding protein [Clostridiales bacterium]
MNRRFQRKNAIFSIVFMSILAVAIVIVADRAKETLGAISGKPVDIGTSNAQEYQVKELYETEDGGHTVLVTAKGFNTDVDIEVLVTFDETADKILSVEVLTQAETDGLGSKITEEDFTTKFLDINAPVKIADLELASPVTGSIGISDGSSAQKVDTRYNPERWNQSDDSPEANAMRKLYAAGLTLSEDNLQGLKTPKADMTAQEIAIVNMEEAGLLDEYLEATGTVSTPETKAVEKLKEAGLLSESEGDSSNGDVGVAVEVTNIDTISGATVSSKAVGKAVNNAYFFLKESILQ